jgi:hypothetical protein
LDVIGALAHDFESPGFAAGAFLLLDVVERLAPADKMALPGCKYGEIVYM